LNDVELVNQWDDLGGEEKFVGIAEFRKICCFEENVVDVQRIV
jgi:hypothetical protein